MSQSGGQSGESLTQVQSRPLNVRDALSYLDDVKTQFAKQPDVYNKFLDIMKDFKTQAIDTPGVIERVSQLFRCHPVLIQGFNTFLPPGYRIDAFTENSMVQMIHIVNPGGTIAAKRLTADGIVPVSAFSIPGKTVSAQPTATTAPVKTEPPSSSDQAPSQQLSGRNTSSQPPPPTATSHAPQSSSSQQQSQLQQQQQQSQSQLQQQSQQQGNMHIQHMPGPNMTSAPSMVATPGAAGILTEQNPQRPPVEFNHAINYVNKIKTRFVNDQTTYKNFLEILQNYQRDNKPIKEVYASVRQLFAGAPDLLEEFAQFLPDHTGEAGSIFGGAGDPRLNAPQQRPGQPQPRAGGKKEKPQDPDYKVGPSGRPPAHASKKMQPSASAMQGDEKRRRKNNDASATGASIAASGISQQHMTLSGSAGKRPRKGGALSPPMIGGPMGPITYEPSVPGVGPPIGTYGVPGKLVRPHQPVLASEPLVTADELAFFDRAKRHIDNRATHQEFLKLLNLFTQNLIDLPTLMEKSYAFLGANEELFNEFKMLVGWDVTEHGLVEGEEWLIENLDALQRPRIDPNHLPGFGPSYKKLPQSEVELACSGRDAHCWSVLNDQWVAHATWASEGSGIHRPNANEEALMYSEQERHWFAVVMTTNQRAISILDPIDTRISMMDDVQRADFKLRPGFNDTNPSIIERAVKKIYCTDGAGTASNARADYALEVINAIYDSPSIAVPIVLARMKQKDEDWQRAVREWNKVWREVEAKNYYRALDHQSAPFKSNDKKTLTSRSLIGEIEHLRKEHKQKRVVADSNSDLPLIPPERSQHQYELRMSDRSVIFDVMRITFAYLERVQSGFSLPERERVEGFLRLFVPLVLGVSRREIEEHFGVFEPKHADDDTDSSDEEAAGSEKDASAAEDQSTSPTVTSTTDGRKKGVKASAADLRRRLLASTVNDPAESSRQPVQDFHSKAASPDLASHQGDSDGLELGTETTWVHASSEPLPDHDLEPGKRHPSPSKESPSREPGVAAGIRRYNFFAGSSFYCLLRVFHMLYHRLQTLKLAAAEMAANHQPARLNPIAVELGISTPLPIIDISASDNKHAAEGYYAHLLELCERYFEQEIDQGTYEENLRMMWGTKAFPLFTVDKMVSALIKHVHSINGEAKCQDMLLLLERDRQRGTTTLRQQIAYRMEAESLLDTDDHLYKFEWIPSHHALTMQLLGASDLTLDTTASPRSHFDYYVSSYILQAPTEGVGAEVKAPMLKRNYRSVSKDQAGFEAESNAELRFGSSSFKLYHVRQTGDSIVRRRSGSLEKEQPARAAEKETFTKWHEKRVQEVQEAGTGATAMDQD